jgi:uncharacterized protein (TIGR02453 family)
MVTAVGKILGDQVEGLAADPRIDRSIYRLYRDTRFSKDKSPLKEHLGLIWWQDLPEGKLSSPCFYFHLTPDGWLWSAGCYRFTPTFLIAFRQAILDPEFGPAFKFIAAGIRRRGLEFNPPDLKRTPAGFSGPEWTTEWLRRKGLYTWSENLPINDTTILGPNAAQYLAKKFLDALPLHLWLIKFFERGRSLEKENLKIKADQPLSSKNKITRTVILPEDDF